ncbi:alpha-glucosidase [Alsobacter metallidurans]|uniref:Alpha-glucosidase n=1 Tax=Alsobacter metallidurans TaxID=340221 RepID=A0A917I5M9_9HYPH|nr:TIM-barrel domain-containing protein [Alsobacter metallidurans]GGH12951.1 alpha-glucosidase [Alsobacter metallidurans]
MKALTRARFAGRDGVSAVFALDYGVEIRIALLEPDLGRVLMRRDGGYRLDRGWTVAPDGEDTPYEGRPRDDLAGFSCPTATVTERDGVVTLAGERLRAEVTLEPFGVAWFRAGESAPFLQDRRTQAYFVSRKTHAFVHHTERQEHDRHYGLGDKAGPLDRTGRRFRIDAVDPCGFDAELSDPLYKMIPFVIVAGPTGAHGVYYDNLATAEVDLGATLDNYHGLFRSYRADDGDLDAYVFAGPGVPDVVQAFSRLTGGHAFGPLWTLGFATTSMAIADAPDAHARIADYVAKCAEHRIPCDSFHFGSGYTMIDGRRYAFHWNRDKFPDPEATLKSLADAGMHPVTNLKPCLLEDHPRLAELRDGGGLVLDGETREPAVAQFWDGLGFHLDFTHPNGRAWWRAGINDALLRKGVVTVWNDNNEYEIWDEDAVAHGDGRPFAQTLARPAQALLMTKLSRDAQVAHAPAKRPYAITRGGAAGIGRYGQTWSGDNETAWKTLRFNLTQGLNMSLSGLFDIGHDVGGFHGPSPGPELLCRFVEFCSFWPRFVMNSWNTDGVTTLPWMHPGVIAPIREAIRLRYRLAPYLYARMWRAALADDPAVRPLFYDFPQDPGAIATEDAFMLGPDLLVAPVLEEGAQTRSVRLPHHPGGWYAFHDGSHHPGGTVATVDAPLGRAPLFVRAGAMLPLAQPGERLDPAQDRVRELAIFGAPSAAEANLYDDDGETAGWREGAGRVTQLLLRDGRLSATAEGRYEPAWREIRVRCVGGPMPAFEQRGPVRLTA